MSALSFSPAQVDRLNHFCQTKEITVPDDWNQLDEHDPLWRQVIDKIQSIFNSQSILRKDIADGAHREARGGNNGLNNRKIKRFLQSHLITSLGEMEERCRKFHESAQVGDALWYRCILPWNPNALVETCLHFSDARDPALATATMIFNYDVLLDESLENTPTPALIPEAFTMKHHNEVHAILHSTARLALPDQETKARMIRTTTEIATRKLRERVGEAHKSDPTWVSTKFLALAFFAGGVLLSRFWKPSTGLLHNFS
jgi:hypothetical protein